MFCPECGENLINSAKFCHKCGKKIGSEMVFQDDVAGEIVAKNLAKDRDFTRRLMAVYDKLVEPLSIIENCSYQNNIMMQNNQQMSGEIENIRRNQPYYYPFKGCIILAVVVFFAGVVIGVNTPGFLGDIVIYIGIAAAIFSIAGLPFIINGIKVHNFNLMRERFIWEKTNMIKQNESAIYANNCNIAKVYEAIKVPLELVPVEYRRSDYVREMVRSFQIGRADNLKEVYNLFEDRKQRGEIKESIYEVGGSIVDSLEAIHEVTNEILSNVEKLVENGINVDVTVRSY